MTKSCVKAILSKACVPVNCYHSNTIVLSEISNFHDPLDSRFGYWMDVKKDDSLLMCVYKELGRSNKPKLGHFTSIEKRCDSEIA